jgi:hypothetical protein
VTQLESHPPFAKELLDLRDLVSVTAAQHFDGNDFARIAMNRAKDPSERSRSNHVQNTIRSVVITKPLTRQHAVELEIGQNSFAKQKSFDLFHGHLFRAQFPPQSVDLLRRCQLQIDASLR